MNNFDKKISDNVKSYLNKNIDFSNEESEKIHMKIKQGKSRRFNPVYWTVLASAVVLFSILSLPLLKTLNFNSNPQSDYATMAENETENINSINWGVNNGSQKILSNEAKNNLQLSIINNPEKYKLRKASLISRKKSGEYKHSDPSEEITLALSFQSQHNTFFTQIFKGEVRLDDNHKVVEKVGDWSLIPASETHINMEEDKYTIAVSEIITNHEKYTIIVQTYDLHDDIDAAPYSKTDILDFTESLKPELAVKNLLNIISED